MNRFVSFLILAIVAPVHGQKPEVALIDSPAPARSGQAHLNRGADGRVRLSWVVREGPNARLAFSTLGAAGWSAPKTVARGVRWFVNWADVPSLVADAEGRLAAHWLDRLGDTTYAYGVRIATSVDGGDTWTKPVWLHDDTSPQEHGFCTLRPIGGGRFRAVWLDGRALDGQHRDMQLRTRTFGVDGERSPEVLLDSRVCECCPTAMVRSSDGVWSVAYRDRSAKEVRDVAYVRAGGGEPESWGSPAPVAVDGWERPG